MMKHIVIATLAALAFPVAAQQADPNGPAWVAYQAGHRDQAVALLKARVAAHPADSQAWNILGLIARDQQQWSVAIGYFDKAIAINPNASNSLLDRGHCYFKLGDFHAAVRDFRAALVIVPSFKLARDNLAAAYYEIYTHGPKTHDAAATQRMASALKEGRSADALAAIEAGADVRAKLPEAYDGGPVAMAAIIGDVKLVDALLDRGADISQQDRMGLTALNRTSYVSTTPSEPYYQATQGMIAALLARGARVDTIDQNGSAPLYGPSRHGDAEIVRMFLAAGADPQGAYVPGHPETSAPPRFSGMQTQVAAAPRPAAPSVSEDLSFIGERTRAATDAMNEVDRLIGGNPARAPTAPVCAALFQAYTAHVDIIRRIASMQRKPVSDELRAQLADHDTNIRHTYGNEIWNTYRRFSCKWTWNYQSDLPRWQGLHPYDL